MTRPSNDLFKCVICGEYTKGVICRGCEFDEMKRQKRERGSVTALQVYKIERLIENLDTETTGEIFLKLVGDYDGDIGNFSLEQAKEVIYALLTLDNSVKDGKIPSIKEYIEEHINDWPVLIHSLD